MKGFRIFCIQHKFKHEIIYDFQENDMAIPNAAYVVIEENDLVNLIKKCKQQELTIGGNVGIISYNETPLKEILLNGITTISTDHELMGRTAAQLITQNRRAIIKNPFTLIKRNSL